MRHKAPRFLNLTQIRYPIGAIASIGHRLSGIFLIVCLPLLVNGLDWSLRSETEFIALRDRLAEPCLAAPLAILVWAAVHHLAAGIRHLLMDAGIGVALPQARASARWVLALGVACGVITLLGRLL